MNSTVENYAYDAIYQLQQVTQGTNTSENYTYDKVGNRLTSHDVATYSYNSSNQLTAADGTSFTYDHNGNTTSKTDMNGQTAYAWDFENRLASVTLPGGGGVVSFKYDPFGRRIQKSSASGTTTYVYDGANGVEELNGSGSVSARYVQGAGIDEPLAQSGAALSFYDADGLGSITSLTDATGTPALTFVYGAFGVLSSSSGTGTNSYRYTGREYDQETGLYYYRARYLDASVGRFVAEDPLFLDGNSYSYVDNNPALEADPTGFDGIVINYDWYQVTVAENLPICNCKAKLPFGHGAAIAVDPKNGKTTYFEYGRYDKEEFGIVREQAGGPGNVHVISNVGCPGFRLLLA